MKIETFGSGQGFLKAGFLGFNKSGKTFTATRLALQLWQTLKLKTPIALADTETGGEYVAGEIRRVTGKHAIGIKSRALADLLALGAECDKGLANILLVDSITHFWREVTEAYLDQVNRSREALQKPKRNRLEFQDWANIKAKWSVWTDFFLNSKLHIIICGRAGYEWDFEEREDASGNKHKELVKTGTKMKVESEFGFEPSLLIEMERVQVPDKTGDHFRIVHRATVLGDRFDVMDSATCDNPTGEFFLPYIRMLTPGAENIVDTELKTDHQVDEAGQAAFDRDRKERTKLLEEIEGEITAAYPGQTKDEKRAKVTILADCFGTKSWTAIQQMGQGPLKAGLAGVRTWIESHKVEESV